MLQGFEVKDFKCHEGYNSIKMPGLTIISGTNNSGKSSFLQALYLLTQNKSKPFPIISLNENLRLGGFNDILNKQKSSDDSIEFSFEFSPKIIEKSGFDHLSVTLVYHNPLVFKNLTLDYSDKNPILSHMGIQYQKEKKEPQTINLDIVDEPDTIFFRIKGPEDEGYCKFQGIVPDSIIFETQDEENRKICSKDFEIIRNYLSLFTTENIRYLRALRPEDFIDKKDSSLNSYLGLSGEYTAEIVYRMWNSHVDFKQNAGKNALFAELFDLWVKNFLGEGYRIRANKTDSEDRKYRISIEEVDRNLQLNLKQVGVGISQILPIITLIFTSKAHDIILIENPEVHLHPQLQAFFVDLCLFAIENNRKLIIETHSEHVINRLRYRVKENPVYLEKIDILFLEKIKGVIRYTEVQLSDDGTIDYWPENFFDQSYKDLLEIIR
jgi:predicted ATPase